MTTIEHLARRAISFQLHSASTVVGTLENCVVDAIGCALAGARHPRYAPLLSLAPDDPTGPLLIGTAKRTDPRYACVANGFAIHAFDFDDDSYVGLLHPTTTVLPALLATASKMVDVDGKRFLTALGAGIDAQCIASLCWSDEAYDHGWWNTALLGGIGAAVATGRLLELSQLEMMHAMAAALANAHGLKSVFGSDQKPLGVGLAARTGYEAAILAQAGFTSPLDIFESPDGFLATRGLTHKGPPGTEAIETSISPIRTPGIAFKPWPVCNAGHAAIEATLQLTRSNDIAADNVARVTVEVQPFVRKCLRHDRPKNFAEAQFSLPFAIASALRGSGPTLDDLEPGRFDRPEIVGIFDRIHIVVAEAVEGLNDDVSHREGARVVINTADGRCFATTVAVAPGQTDCPLESSAIDTKFLTNAARTLPRLQAEMLLTSLRDLFGSSDADTSFALAALDPDAT